MVASLQNVDFGKVTPSDQLRLNLTFRIAGQQEVMPPVSEHQNERIIIPCHLACVISGIGGKNAH